MWVGSSGSGPGHGSHRGCPLTDRCWRRGSPGGTRYLGEHSVGSTEEQAQALVCRARDGVGTTGPEAPERELRWPRTRPPMPGTPSSQPAVPPPPHHREARPVEPRGRGRCPSNCGGPRQSRWDHPPCSGSVGTADGAFQSGPLWEVETHLRTPTKAYLGVGGA